MIAFLVYLLVVIGAAALIARKWIEHEESEYSTADNEDRAFAVFMSTLIAAFWPVTLPLALIVGSVWLLAFKKKSQK